MSAIIVHGPAFGAPQDTLRHIEVGTCGKWTFYAKSYEGFTDTTAVTRDAGITTHKLSRIVHAHPHMTSFSMQGGTARIESSKAGDALTRDETATLAHLYAKHNADYSISPPRVYGP